MRDKLNIDAVLMQLPIGEGKTFEGCHRPGDDEGGLLRGNARERTIRRERSRRECMQAEAETGTPEHAGIARSMYSDEMMELLLAEEADQHED